MTAKEIQSLKIGDKVKYADNILEVKDWKCHKDIVMLGSERIYSEPIFNNITRKTTQIIHPGFWKMIEFIK